MSINTFINSDKLFIDPETFYAMVPSARKVSDTQSMYYSIAMCQKKTIRDILGQDLYDDILAKYTLYVDSGTSMSTEYTYLMNNYLKPILSIDTYRRLIDVLSNKLGDAGLRTVQETTTFPSEGNDKYIIKKELMDDINTFIKDMKKYIYDNQSSFTLYDQGFDGVNQKRVSLMIGKVQNPKKSIYNKIDNR